MQRRKFETGGRKYTLVARGEAERLKRALDLVQHMLVTSATPLAGMVEVEEVVVSIRWE